MCVSCSAEGHDGTEGGRGNMETPVGSATGCSFRPAGGAVAAERVGSDPLIIR